MTTPGPTESELGAVRRELTIERLAKSGEGVAQDGGRAIFVFGALPGERVTAEVTEVGKVLRGELIEVLEPSSARREPPCALATECGGCGWLHLTETEQLRAKEQIVQSALAHAGLDPAALDVAPSIASPQAMAYRRRASLHPVKGRLGFSARRSHQRVVVDACPALTGPLERLPSLLADALGPAALKDVDEIHLLECEARLAISVHLKGALRPRIRETLEGLVREGLVVGAALVPVDGRGATISIGDPEIEEDGLFHRPDGFAQANAAVNRLLVAGVIDSLELDGACEVVEFFSGNGNLTLPVAEHARRVVAVESSAVSVRLAQRAAARRRSENVRFVQGDASRAAEGFIREGLRFERLLLDPPRAGAPLVGQWASQLLSSRVVYVACDPMSLARDASSLMSQGYRPTRMQLFDLFPQTPHVEVVMSFARG